MREVADLGGVFLGEAGGRVGGRASVPGRGGLPHFTFFLKKKSIYYFFLITNVVCAYVKFRMYWKTKYGKPISQHQTHPGHFVAGFQPGS